MGSIPDSPIPDAASPEDQLPDEIWQSLLHPPSIAATAEDLSEVPAEGPPLQACEENPAPAEEAEMLAPPCAPEPAIEAPAPAIAAPKVSLDGFEPFRSLWEKDEGGVESHGSHSFLMYWPRGSTYPEFQRILARLAPEGYNRSKLLKLCALQLLRASYNAATREVYFPEAIVRL